MKIEVLYPEVANLYGDLFNIKYLEQTIPNCKVYYTNLNAKPKFVDEDIDLIYMGSMMERFQEKIIKKLLPYKKRINELILNDKVFLITGNAIEIFFKQIDDINALGIFETKATRDFSIHHSSCFLGEFDKMDIVGFRSQFSFADDTKYPFMKVKKGYGFKNNNLIEGIKYHNFYGTYIIGPLLILNPLFTKYLLKILKQDTKLLYEDDIIKAYNIRKDEYNDETVNFK